MGEQIKRTIDKGKHHSEGKPKQGKSDEECISNEKKPV